MPNKNRLQKRQAEYLKASGIYLETEDDDLFQTEKNSVAYQIGELNKKISQLSPYKEDGTLKSEDKLSSKLSPEDCDNLIDLYQKSIKEVHKLVTALNDRIDSLDEEANESANPYFAQQYMRERNSYDNIIKTYDKIAKTMSKDLRALQYVKKKDLKVSIDTVFENSRVNSEYEVVGEIKQSDKGNQNERIPLTIKTKDGQPVKGYFTTDSKPKYGSYYFKKAVRDARKKYGKDAKNISTTAVFNLYNTFVDKNSDALSYFLQGGSALTMMGYDKAVETLSKNMGKSLKSYINTPQKLNMFIDVFGKGVAAINQQNILEGIGINEKARVNRRNAAMSKMADLLGCPDLIANSEDIKIKINGKSVKGTFMKEAVGEDIAKVGKDSLMLESTPLSGLDLNLKKQVASLQVLDFLCGNPDRHSGNMLYHFVKDKNGKTHLKSIQGIDNDSAFGSTKFDEVGMSSVKLDSMKVIPEELANRIMNLDTESLKQMLYGFDMTTREINNALGRLTQLQNKIKNDAKEYTKGYTEGYIIPGTIKSVSDDELSSIPFDELTLLSQKSKNKNQFDRVSEIMKPSKNVDLYYGNTKNAYEKEVYNYSVGSIDKVSNLIGELNKDNRFGGSSTGYNDMVDALKDLNKKLVSFSGPVCGREINTQNGHVKEVIDLREKYRETLVKVNEYIAYKNSKKKGEEWRNIQGPHEVSRTERRYHDAIKCREFLSKQLDRFDELDRKLNAYNECKHSYARKNADAGKKEMMIFNDEGYRQNFQVYEDKLYQNHLSRSKYQIKELFDKMQSSKQQFKPYHTMNYEVALGYGLYSVKPEDKENFKKEIEELTGTKITLSDDELLKRAIASDLVVTKASCSSKIEKAKKNPKEKVHKNTQELFDSLKHIEIMPFDKAVNNLLKNDTFESFYKSYKDDFYLKDMYKTPGVPNLDFEGAKGMVNSYNKALYKIHPELQPPKQKEVKKTEKKGKAMV